MEAEETTADPELFDKIVNLSKRRGFVFQSADIYGGFRSTYDYGPLGVLLLRNVKDQWWRSMVQMRHDVVGLDASILSPPAVWEASGHLANFTDPLVDCKECRAAIVKTNSTTPIRVLRVGLRVRLPKRVNLI
jgi:glycyl-tRNA synthetase (EC 6.1.1.14)